MGRARERAECSADGAGQRVPEPPLLHEAGPLLEELGGLAEERPPHCARRQAPAAAVPQLVPPQQQAARQHHAEHGQQEQQQRHLLMSLFLSRVCAASNRTSEEGEERGGVVVVVLQLPNSEHRRARRRGVLWLLLYWVPSIPLYRPQAHTHQVTLARPRAFFSQFIICHSVPFHFSFSSIFSNSNTEEEELGSTFQGGAD